MKFVFIYRSVNNQMNFLIIYIRILLIVQVMDIEVEYFLVVFV